ncbi:hypothetical protein [Paenibacillus polymyxa]|uniref:hypothetical protein n=1 Tax=Paenibacillus polymyxa TaxID=1406 RepID=UPI002377FA04|nr:hypothetical protein [Paenibacillus polymyxa]WDM22615.1 hypothetical protein J4I02_03055 [Paenibacillus polymyxa]
MDKAKITKAQAQAVNLLKKVHPESSIVRMHVEYPEKWSKDFEGVNGMELDLLIRALYNGYEVELTMEERMLAHFKEPKGYLAEYDTENVIYRKGMAKALEIAGIKVPGIND